MTKVQSSTVGVGSWWVWGRGGCGVVVDVESWWVWGRGGMGVGREWDGVGVGSGCG